jgi:hypothetical protein
LQAVVDWLIEETVHGLEPAPSRSEGDVAPPLVAHGPD